MESEREGKGRQKRRDLGKSDLHRILGMALRERVQVLIVTMILQDGVSVMKGVNVKWIGGCFSFAIGHVLMGPDLVQKNGYRMAGRDVVVEDKVVQKGRVHSVSTNQDTGPFGLVMIDLFHDLVPGHADLSHEITRW